MEQNLQYTRRLDAVFRDEIGTLQFISRHKLLAALDDYLNTAPANRLIRTKRLEKLCREAGLAPDEFIRDPAVVETLPTAQQVLSTRMPQAFYKLYRATPASGDYMARLVQRLAPEYAHLPVRLAIVKKALTALGENCRSLPTGDLIRWARQRMTPDEQAQCDALPPAERLQRLADTLDDSVFALLEQPGGTASLLPAEVLGCMETRLRKDLAAGTLPAGALTAVEGDDCLAPLLVDCGCTAEALSDKLTALKAALAAGTLTEDTVNAALPADRFEPFHKAFRRRLSEVFASGQTTGKKNPAALYKDNLKDAKNKRKKAAGDWAVLRLADDLAAGVFRPNGTALKQLYYFAFLFGLQAPRADAADGRYDLEQALFRDYHAENTLQQLLRHTTATEAVAIDTVVSCGINWKNYAEMCYLYWLPGGGADAQGALSPGRRIDRAEAMIDSCYKAAASAKTPLRRTAPTQHTLTAYYREQARHFFVLSEPAARDYLVANYQILTAPGVARLEAAADTNTAYRHADEQRAQLARTARMDEEGESGRDNLSPQLLALADRLQALLKAPYTADTDYCAVVDALHRRLFLPRYPGADASPELLLAVLYQLCRTEVPLTAAALRDTLERRQIPCRGTELPTAINRLRAIGFVIIGREADTSGKARYRLTPPAAGTPQQQLVQLLQALAYFHTTDSAQKQLQDLLEAASPTRHRVSRTEFVALHALNYLEQYGMSHSRMQDIVQEFRNDINWDLEQARYQTLSSKNLFDVYILLLMFIFSAQDTASYAVPLTYRLCGGFNPDENPANHLIGQTLTLVPPTRAGYRFAGWRTAPGAAPQPQLTLAPYDFTHYTLTAVWEKQPASPLP